MGSANSASCMRQARAPAPKSAPRRVLKLPQPIEDGVIVSSESYRHPSNDAGMYDILVIFVHLIVTLVRLIKPRGLRAVVGESALTTWDSAKAFAHSCPFRHNFMLHGASASDRITPGVRDRQGAISRCRLK